MMMEVINLDDQEVLLANGNRMKGVDYNQLKEPTFSLNSPEVRRRLQDHKEAILREKQFSELILHVLAKIQKETEDVDDNTLRPEVSLLDMKRFLRGDVKVAGVSENSPIFILESVSSAVGQVLHNCNIFELWQLAACTKTELAHIIKHAKGVQGSDLEFAAQDAKSVMDILSAVARDAKAKEDASPWSTWGNFSQVTDLLNIKENTKKIMDNLSSKGITASIVDVFVGPAPSSEGDDIETFQEL